MEDHPAPVRVATLPVLDHSPIFENVTRLVPGSCHDRRLHRGWTGPSGACLAEEPARRPSTIRAVDATSGIDTHSSGAWKLPP